MLKTLSLVALLTAASLGTAAACQPTEPTKQLRREILAKYQAGQRDAGHRLLSRFDYASTWAAHGQVTVTAVFDSRAKGMTLYAERKPGVSSTGDMLIAIPPGTRFLPAQRGGDLPQELILARGEVILMGSYHSSETAVVPVLCSTYRRQGPQPGVKYTLSMAQPDSALDRVAQAVCSGSRAPQVSEAALAVWIASGSAPTPQNLGARRYLTFHEPRQAITPAHVEGAKAILKRAGLELSAFAFFKHLEQGTQATEPTEGEGQGEVEEPSQEPAPTGASS